MKRLFKPFLSSPPDAPAAPPASLAAQALERLPQATLVADDGGRIVYASQAVSRLLGWSAAELDGAPIGQLFAPAQQASLAAWLAGVQACGDLDNPPAAPEADVTLLRKNQQPRNARMSVLPLPWQGRVHACLSLRVAALENVELRLAREEMLRFQQASENKSLFLANMSHEIRTPLNGMLGMIDLLASSTLDAQQQVYLSSLKKSSRNLRALIDDVLDFSKIEAGVLQTERVPFDMHDVMGAVVDAFAPLAASKGLALQLRQSLEQRRYLGDPHRLSQVLSNLVSNALKFTHQGSVQLAVSARTLLPAQDAWRVTISVSDTGIGIAPAQQAQLFEAFQQASASVSRHYGGSGLGLFISRQLVTLMGGQLSVASEPGKGSTFEFRLDLQPSYAPAQPVDTAPPSRLEPLAGARILVVDDDLTNQALLQAWLGQAEAVVVCRTNGQEALDELRKGEYFDAVLMDVSMPVMDGLTATRHIRQPRPEDSGACQRYLAALPVIGISGHAFSEDVARCLEAGMTGSLTKPLSRVAMLKKLTSVLGGPQEGDDPAAG